MTPTHKPPSRALDPRATGPADREAGATVRRTPAASRSATTTHHH